MLKFGKELLRTVRNRTLLIIFLRRWGRGINAGGEVGITNETEVINAFHEPASNGIDEKQTS